jgi:HEAT repeat-containing protein 5
MYTGVDGQTPSASDVDTIVGLCAKSMEGGDQVTRNSLAALAGHMLASTQTPRVVPSPESSKKEQDKTGDDAEPAGVAASQETTKPLMSVSEMLNHLSVHFTKPNASRKTRIGIFEIYIALFNKLGPSFVEGNYAAIVAHFMNEITPQPKTRYEVLLVRKLISVVLRDQIGVRMLSEQGQIGAIQELANSYLKRWPAMMPGRTAPSSIILTIVLREVAGLLQQLGNAPPPVQVLAFIPRVGLSTDT